MTENDNTDLNKYTFSSIKEGTDILSFPNKTLLCAENINIYNTEWKYPNPFKFSAILSCLIEKNNTVIYTATIEKISNGILTGPFIADFIRNENLRYLTIQIDIISKDIKGDYIMFDINDVAIVKIYGHSISDEQNKLITSPKLLNPFLEIIIVTA